MTEQEKCRQTCIICRTGKCTGKKGHRPYMHHSGECGHSWA